LLGFISSGEDAAYFSQVSQFKGFFVVFPADFADAAANSDGITARSQAQYELTHDNRTDNSNGLFVLIEIQHAPTSYRATAERLNL
jgi:hypothetical protein